MVHAHAAREARLVYTLCADLIGYTAGSIAMTQREMDRFSRALVTQIEPHLDALGFDDLNVKFTGDGWLLTSPELQDAERLCALASIMRTGFHREMSERTGLAPARIPELRMAICTGRDLRVTLWQGSADWVGDSVRRATRSASFCHPNEVLVDATVNSLVMRDFSTEQIDPGVRPGQPKRTEEEIPLWSLGDLRIEAVEDWDIPAAYVYLLTRTGRTEEAEQASRRAAAGIDADSTEAGAIARWNRLIRTAPTYGTVLELWERMLESTIPPDAGTLNALIERAPTSAEATRWATELTNAGVHPDIRVFNELIHRAEGWDAVLDLLGRLDEHDLEPDEETAAALIFRAPSFGAAVGILGDLHNRGVEPSVPIFRRLISKAPGYERACSVLEIMAEWLVRPDVGVFNALVALAPTNEEARTWLGRMEEAGVAPEVSTINTLIARAQRYGEAAEWFEEMQARSIHPDVNTFNTLMARVPTYEVGVSLLASMEAHRVAPNSETFTPLIARAPDYSSAIGWLDEMTTRGISPNSEVFRSLIIAAPDYESAADWLESTEAHGVTENTEIYRTLIGRAPDYAVARSLLDRMIETDVAPTVETFRSLLVRVPNDEAARQLLAMAAELGIRPTADLYLPLITAADSYQEAQTWVDHMREAGVAETVETMTAAFRKTDTYADAERLLDEMRARAEPDESAYKVLVDLSPDLLTAQSWVEEMRSEGMRPGSGVLAAVLGKDPEGMSGDALLAWYLNLDDRPGAPMGIAIDSYRRRGLISDALRLALDYPHLDAARVLFSEHQEHARAYLSDLLNRQPGHPNGRYALGLALIAIGENDEAIGHLEMARELARPGPRVAALEEILRNVRGING